MDGKRSEQFLKSLLEEIEANTSPVKSKTIERDTTNYSDLEPDVVLLHYALLLDAGYLHGEIDPKAKPAKVYVSRMTWAGYEYLEALRRKFRDPMLTVY